MAAVALALAAVPACSKGSSESQSVKPPGLPAATAPTPPPAPNAAPPPAPAAAGQGGAGVAAADEVPAAPDTKSAISGTITLPAARKKDVAKGDTIYLIARRPPSAGGRPMPVAVQRHTAGDFPKPFMLSGRDSMIPGVPFDGELNIEVRVDKDGDAMTRRKGDVRGEAMNVKVGSTDVVIPLDTVLKEDVTLGGPMGGGHPGGGMPAGHP